MAQCRYLIKHVLRVLRALAGSEHTYCELNTFKFHTVSGILKLCWTRVLYLMDIFLWEAFWNTSFGSTTTLSTKIGEMILFLTYETFLLVCWALIRWMCTTKITASIPVLVMTLGPPMFRFRVILSIMALGMLSHTVYFGCSIS